MSRFRGLLRYARVLQKAGYEPHIIGLILRIEEATARRVRELMEEYYGKGVV